MGGGERGVVEGGGEEGERGGMRSTAEVGRKGGWEGGGWREHNSHRRRRESTRAFAQNAAKRDAVTCR